MQYTIYTISGGEIFRNFFNGVATLVNSDLYSIAFKIIIILGVLWYGFRASNGALKDAIKWIITTILVVYIMIFAKASIVIEDRANIGLAGNKIDNVPFGLATIAGISSALDYNLTKGFEKIFSVPDDLQYSENGLILGTRIIKDTAFAEFAKSGGLEKHIKFKINFQEFLEACVIVNAQMGVPYNVAQLKSSTDLWSLISNKDGLSPIFTFNYINENNSSELLTCKEGIDKIANDLTENFNATEKKIANKIFPNYSEALSKYQQTHKTTLDYLTNNSTTATDNLRQAIMINEIQQSMSKYAYSGNGLSPYEQAKRDVQQRSHLEIIGQSANSWLTKTKILVESLLYALFPLVMLYTIAPFGGIGLLGIYIKTFAWLILWGPCYAVVNMIANDNNKTQTSNTIEDGLTIANQLDIWSVQEQISAMAGYYLMLVPIITLIVFKGSDVMTSLTHKLGAIMESTAGQVATESATGNSSLGNTSLNNVSANKYDASTFFKGQGHSTEIMDSGVSRTISSDGNESYDASSTMSRLGVEFQNNMQKLKSLSNSQTNSETLANNYDKTSSNIESSARNMAINSSVSSGFKVDSNDQYSQSQQELMQESMNFAKQGAENISNNTGLTSQQALSASASVKYDGLSFLGFKSEFGGSLSGNVTEQEAYNMVKEFSNSKGFSESMNVMQQNSKNESISYTDYQGKDQTKTIGEALNISKQYSESASEHRSISQNLSSQIQDSINNSFGANINQNHEFIDYMKNQGYQGEELGKVLAVNNKDYDGARKDLIFGFMEEKNGSGDYKSISNISPSINQSTSSNIPVAKSIDGGFAVNNNIGSREFLANFENENNVNQVQSNSHLKNEVEGSINNAQYNIDAKRDRFENQSTIESNKIKERADDGVIQGSVKETLGKGKDFLFGESDK